MKEIGALILWCKGYSLIEGGFIKAGVHLVEGLRFYLLRVFTMRNLRLVVLQDGSLVSELPNS